MSLLAAGAIVLLAALVQRITGLGFALVATPALVLLLGPAEGVQVVVLIGIVACGSMGLTMWRSIDWRRAFWLIWPAIVVAPLAAWVTAVSPGPVLLLIVGLAAVLGLLTARVRRASVLLVGRPGAIAAGALAGFLNVTSGLSGPPLVAYADSVRWELRRFVATLQVIFVAYNILTVIWRGAPAETPWTSLALLAIVALAGIGLGTYLSRFVTATWARWAMFTVAWAGAVVVLVRGAMGVSGIV
jgi:uncharacterized membrane protein YfcA